MADLTNGAADADVADDLHADLAAAFDTPADTGATEAATTTVAEPPATTQEGPARDDQGRFAAKPADTVAKPQEEPVAPPQGQQQAVQPPTADAAVTLRPPPGWSIAAKAAFAALPKDVQEAVVKREQEVDSGFAKLQAYKDFDKVIEPHASAIAMRGVTPAQAFNILLNAQARLDRDPVNGIAELARSYGVDLRQFAQPQANGQQQGHQPNPLAQFLDPLRQEIQALKGHITTQQQQAVEYQRSQASAEIQAFAADPKRIYLNDLQGDMALLIESGRAKDLAEAYDMAAWAHPVIRTTLIKEQMAADQAEAQRKAAEVAAKARQAGGSIAGAPVPGSASLGAAPPDSIEATIAAAWTEAGGRL